ncbi:MAG: [Bacteroidaceae bacterium]|nr:[FeFe] hydrogenase H-cluster maturation GTPase HydF [Bacteroidaceae bacterium]
MTTTARSARYHIGIFGRRNAGKSSLINALAGQQVSIVSDVAGTTTDVVWKNIELPGIGAAVIGDTAGYDDSGALGELRVESTRRAIARIDLAVVLLTGNHGNAVLEKEWQQLFAAADVPVIYLLARSDESTAALQEWSRVLEAEIIPFSSVTQEGMPQLLERMAACYNCDGNIDDITHSLVKAGDVVLLVMPQDAQAPTGRLIMPQVQTLRNLLDKHCMPVCCAPEELPRLLSALKEPPALVITDSQVFPQVKQQIPQGTRLTSFSVLMARHKGDIDIFRAGAEHLLSLKPDAHILIAEACTHIPANEDIGRVKLPRLLHKRFGDGISIDVVSGNDFPADLSAYDIVIHCGACMFTRRHVLSRVRQARAQGVPITNYGIAIAALTGILHNIVY